MDYETRFVLAFSDAEDLHVRPKSDISLDDDEEVTDERDSKRALFVDGLEANDVAVALRFASENEPQPFGDTYIVTDASIVVSAQAIVEKPQVWLNEAIEARLHKIEARQPGALENFGLGALLSLIKRC
jgi:hypothetical protein